MTLDQTDKTLINGLVITVVFIAVAYFSPWYGYQEESRLEDSARDMLNQTNSKYVKHYPPMHPAVMGRYSADAPESVEDTHYVADLKAAYEAANKETDAETKEKEAASRMSFEDWTEVPADRQRDPGVFFSNTYLQRRLNLEDDWRRAKVECLDPDIGFKKWSDAGAVGKMDLDKSKEYLRELFIAEMIVRLAIKAKQSEEQHERSMNREPEAFMRIISVTPSESVPTGPSALIANPNFDFNEKNPLSPKFKKYNLRLWRNFVQEYPVEIVLQCDVNSFMRFLYSVRAPGQFLVIRNLEIVSPFMLESRVDKSELLRFKPTETADQKRWPPKEEHILVTISASGMDFFDPDKLDSLYKKDKDKKETPGGTVRRRRMAAPQARVE